MKMMALMLKRYFYPLSGKIIFWNVVLFVFIKLVFPYSAFQFASLIDSLPVFNSRDVIVITNEIRSDNQLSSLKANAKLDLAAEEKLNDMASNEYFAHISPNGVTPWFWVKRAQYQYKTAGENLAIGFATPKDTLQAWLNSSSHKANLLNAQYQDIGVAVKGVKIGENQGILVVQMFGSPAKTGQSIKKTVTTITVPGSVPTPVIIPSPTPTLPPAVITAQTRGEFETISSPEIVIQYISTDTKIPAVEKPLSVEFQNAEKIQQLTTTLNNTFTIYALASAFLSVIAFLFIEKNRYVALKMSLHTAIFILAVFLPMLRLTFKALIF